MMSYEQLENIINGKYSTWKDLGSKTNDTIHVVFDRNGSANARFLKERFLGKKDFPKNVFAAKSNSDVVAYVSQNRNAIGIIGLNWISDQDDSSAAASLKRVRVVALTLPDTTGVEKNYNKPLQAYIALKTYPLTRGVYIISREGRNGLGTGFASFVAGDKGQRMIRMMGLLPATMPIRIVKVNTE
jgi:phosphate transport system substrate-binding protein